MNGQETRRTKPCGVPSSVVAQCIVGGVNLKVKLFALEAVALSSPATSAGRRRARFKVELFALVRIRVRSRRPSVVVAVRRATPVRGTVQDGLVVAVRILVQTDVSPRAVRMVPGRRAPSRPSSQARLAVS